MLIEAKCNLCGSEQYAVLYKTYEGDLASGEKGYRITDHSIASAVRVIRCRKCGLIYLNPRLDEGDLSCLYSQMEDDVYLSQEKGRRLAARQMLGGLRKFQSPEGRILDVGCATGFLLDEARKQGWDPHGVELSGWAVRFARERLGLEHIFEGDLHGARYPSSSFDVIVLKDVIEHLSDPMATLREIRRILKPSGVICVNTPNISSFISRFLGAKWWGIKRHHLYYFTPKTLSSMLKAVGFVPIRFRSHARVFTLEYWFRQLCLHKKGLNGFLRLVERHPWLKERMIRLDLGDQMEVFARRARSLEYLDELEAVPGVSVKRKMKTVAVLPAYNAAKTLKRTVSDIPRDLVDEIILVDDASTDETVAIARELGLCVVVHDKNKGYGANQKTCYIKALEIGADVVVMVHPDYQYDPKAIPELIEPILKGEADAVFGSRMMKRGALEGGMPLWKHSANILLTAFENVALGTYLTEYHSGFRAYSARYLKSVAFQLDSDGFVFDTEIIVQGLLKHMRIEEVPIRTRYFDEASTIKLWPSILYGLGIFWTLAKYFLHTKTFIRLRQFSD